MINVLTGLGTLFIILIYTIGLAHIYIYIYITKAEISCLLLNVVI